MTTATADAGNHNGPASTTSTATTGIGSRPALVPENTLAVRCSGLRWVPYSHLNVTRCSAAGHRALIYTNEGQCQDTCLDTLHTIRQSRRMLSQEMERLVRVVLHGESSPDTVFLAEQLSRIG